MEAMRHSDIRLTTKTYTDTDLLPVSDAAVKLPSFTRPQVKDSQRDSQSSPRASQALSIPVIKMTNRKELKETDEHGLRSFLSTPVTTGQEIGKWSGRQDLNLRPRGPKPRALPS
jgi:hypothetical protein